VGKIGSPKVRYFGDRRDKTPEYSSRSGNSESARSDLDRPLVETRGGDRGVGSRDIGIPVDRRSGKSTLKTPTQIWAVRLREDTCHVIVHSGDPDTRHRYIGTREIGVSEVVKVGTSEVSKMRGVI
jgi:hypothetical protein